MSATEPVDWHKKNQILVIHKSKTQKLTDKYNQTVVGWCKGSQFIYPQSFVVIGMVDLKNN